MTLAEFDTFLAEMKTNGQHVILLDFLSQLGGGGVLDQDMKDMLVEAGVKDDYFHLTVPFDKRCHLAGLFGVTQAPFLVAVSVHNKAQREKDSLQVVEFIRRVKANNLP